VKYKDIGNRISRDKIYKETTARVGILAMTIADLDLLMFFYSVFYFQIHINTVEQGIQNVHIMQLVVRHQMEYS
jgi:hypothetical protein